MVPRLTKSCSGGLHSGSDGGRSSVGLLAVVRQHCSMPPAEDAPPAILHLGVSCSLFSKAS